MWREHTALHFVFAALCVVSAYFALSVLAVHAATEIVGYPSGTNGTLSAEGGPYIVTSDIVVGAGQVLVVEPGAVVKMQSGRNMVVQNGGTAQIGSNEGAQTVITSEYDDLFGGDTNQDGNASYPSPGDWGRIQINSDTSSVVLENVIIRYGGGIGGAMLTLTNGASGTVASSVFEHSGSYGAAISHDGTFLSISSLVVRNNQDGIGVSSMANTSITDSLFFNNERGIAIDASADVNNIVIRNNSFEKNTVAAIEFSDPDDTLNAANNWWYDNSGPSHKDNVGGEGETVIGSVAYDPWERRIEPVILVPGILGSWGNRLDPILQTYTDLLLAMDAAGYEDGVDLFGFPYNWRQDNTISAQQLKQKIDEVKAITGKSKVDIVAHSMGGLVARSYIQGGDYTNDIDQLIFLGTPHRGSPEAYPKWEAGEFEFDFGKGYLMERIFSLEAHYNGYDFLDNYIHEKVVSVEQLLPVYNYLKNEQGEFRTYPDGYPENQFLEKLSTNLNNLQDSGIALVNIIGDTQNNDTVVSYTVTDEDNTRISWMHGQLIDTENGLGDTTVPASSASHLSQFGVSQIMLDCKHRELPTCAQKYIIKELRGTEPSLYFNTYFLKYSPLNRFLLFRIFSPVDMTITSPSGQTIGKNFETGTTINEIEDAFYSGFDGDTEFVFIANPEDGEYIVSLQGTGEGEYTLVTDYISDIEEVTQESVGQAILEQQVEYHVAYSADNPQSMRVAPEDSEPPHTDINITGISAGTDAYVETATASLSSTDNESGVHQTEYSIDDGASWALYTEPIILDTIGDITLSYRATDNVGNTETVKTKTIHLQEKQQQGAVPAYIFQPPPTNSEPERRETQEGEVLGESMRQDTQYYTDTDILSALAVGDLETLLDYLGIKRNAELEKIVAERYGSDLPLEQKELAHFISYGTKSTQGLGTGERAGVLHSYREAFGTLPEVPDDWLDIINIATGTPPFHHNADAEQRAIESFEKIYSRTPDMKQQNDRYAIIKMAYGLRPQPRDMQLERVGIGIFVRLYGAVPSSTSEWNVVRVLSY